MFGLSRQEMRFSIVISSAHLTQHFLASIIPPLLPILAIALVYPLWQLGLLVSLYSLGSGLGQAPLGVLSDRYDRRYILPVGMTIAAIAYVLFAAAPIVGSIIPSISVFGLVFDGRFIVMCFSMIVVGIGTAVVHPTGYSLITANITPANKGKVLGAFGSSSKLGDAASPAVIGVLILVLVWEQIIMVLGLVGVAYGIVLYLVLRYDEFQTVPPGVEEDENTEIDKGTPSETVWTADKRAYMYPMAIIYLFFVSKKFAANGLTTFVPVFIVAVYAYSFEIMGVFLAPESVANFYFSILLVSAAGSQLVFGSLTDVYDPRTVILSCISLATIGLLGLSLIDLSPLLLFGVVVLLGSGLWGLNPARDALISEITPPEREGRTFGYIWTAVQLTGTVIPVLIGYLLESIGMRFGFLVLAMGTIVGGIFISLLYFDRFYVANADQTINVDFSD